MYTFGNVGIERRRGLLADGSGIKSFRTGWGDRTAGDWRHQRFHQEIFRKKLTNLTFATITREMSGTAERQNPLMCLFSPAVPARAVRPITRPGLRLRVGTVSRGFKITSKVELET